MEKASGWIRVEETQVSDVDLDLNLDISLKRKESIIYYSMGRKYFNFIEHLFTFWYR